MAPWDGLTTYPTILYLVIHAIIMHTSIVIVLYHKLIKHLYHCLEACMSPYKDLCNLQLRL